MNEWKKVDPNSCEALKLFISDWLERSIKAGYFTEPDDTKAGQICKKVDDEIFQELDEYLNASSSVLEMKVDENGCN